MIIAVNTRFLLPDQLEGYGYFLLETLQRITRTYKEHQFIFLFDRPFDERFVFADNVKPVVIGPPARHPLLWKVWYDVKVPAALRRYKADVFVSCDGFCSLTTRVPQCLVIHDLAYIHYPSFITRSHYLFYKYYTPRFIDKAASIATVSQFSKNDIVTNYKIDPERIKIVPNAAREVFKPLSESSQQKVKEKYTEGREYFIYTGSVHPRKNLMNLLKAFSIFKQRQKSNWKLVIAGRLAWKYKKFIDDLASYKYRNDVIMTGYLPEEELARLTASAYCLIYPSLWEGFGVPVLEALQCQVPVITSVNSPMQEIAKEAALYIDPADHRDIAEKMMTLYKDESLRGKLIRYGNGVIADYDWSKSAKLLWQCILQAVK